MNTNKFLQWFILGGLFLILLLPLYVSNSMFFPFISGKNFAFRIIVELITGAWIILALRDTTYRPKKSLILYALATFIGVMAVADMLSENPFKSFWSNYERMEGFVTLVHLASYFIVASSMLNIRNLWERFWQTSLGVNAILVGYGIMQLAGRFEIHQGSTRIDATLGNATYFAAYLLFHIFIAAFLAIRHKGATWIRYAYGAMVILDLVMLYHTATRGAILGLLGGAMLTTLLIAIFEKEHVRLKKYTIGVLVVTLLIPATLFLLRDNDWVNKSPVLSRFTSISLHEKTTESRFMIWNMAFQGFKERPVFGWGQESFNFVFNKYYDPKMYDQEPWFDRAHNVFFDWLIAGGLLGLLAYLSLFVVALYYLWRKGGALFSITEKSIFTGLFAGYFFNNLFVFDNLTSYILFFTVIAYLHSMYGTFWSKGNTSLPGKINHSLQQQGAAMQSDIIFPPIVIIATIFILYFINYHPIAANLDLISSLQRQKDLETNLTYFKQAIAHDSLGTSEAREQLTMAASRIVNVDTDQKTKNDFVSTATSELEKQISAVPKDARYQIFMGSFLSQIGNYDQALKYLKNAQTLTPKKQQVYFEIANVYLNKRDFKNAIDAAKIAYELEPNYDTARVTYAVTLIYGGDTKKANEILAALPSATALDMQSGERLFKAYIDTKNYNGAKEVLNKLIAGDPNNYRYHASFAALYLQNGERQNAVMEIQKAIDLNPDFKSQGEYYIKEIKAGRNP